MPATLPGNASPSPAQSPVKSRKLFLLLAAFIIIVLAAGFAAFIFKPTFFNFLNRSSASYVKGLKTQTSNLKFPSTVWRDRLDENYSKVLNESDRQKQYEAFLNSFEIISGVYTTDPKQATRDVLGGLKGFIKGHYNEFYQEERFTIACLDEGCPKANFPKEIGEILTMIDKVDSLDNSTKEKALLSLRKASLGRENSEAWSHYDAAFQLLNSEYKKSKDEKLKEALKKFVEFIKESYPKDYQIVVRAEGDKNHYKLD